MNNVQLNFGQTPLVFPESPEDGDTHLLTWITYVYSAEQNTWISEQAMENPLAGSTFNITDADGPKVRVTNAELILDAQKNDLSHRIHCQKIIALQYGTEEEFADYFAALDALLENEDPVQICFPTPPFDAFTEPGVK
ncbi:MAG: hypothetical protein ACO24H_03275 [Polynucleobacter sp.]